MQLTRHGGRCCGIRHIYGFSGGPKQLAYNYDCGRNSRLLTQLKRHIRENGLVRGGKGKMFEVVLTDNQITENPDWIPELKTLDFRLVTRFHNSTGGWCNVFHKTSGVCRDDKVPSWWKDEAPRIMGVR
jgi:hypothetical protein